MTSDIILKSAGFSLIVQLLTAVVGLYGITLNIAKDHYILKELLILETTVQIIELSYYIWLIYSFTSIKYDITFTRYFDWILSTPIMIISTVLYMKYRTTENNEKSSLRLVEMFKSNATIIFQILLANATMLLFGFLGEKKILSRTNAFIGGSIMFLIEFFAIYYYYVKNDVINKALFWFMFSFWGLYGVAFCFSYSAKNTTYNILDIFSKNFYGLFLFNEVRKLSL